MNKYLWINIASLAFNLLVLVIFFRNSTRTGLAGNIAGAFFVLVIAAAVIWLIHLACVMIMYFSNNATFSVVMSVISITSSVSLGILSGKNLIQSLSDQKRWHEETEEAERKANTTQGKMHQQFVEAIYRNDTAMVRQLAKQQIAATDEDLSIAVTQCFDVDSEISPEIFKILLDHGANARTAPKQFIYNRFCKNFEAVRLLLDAGADPHPDKHFFPIVCLSQLKLLLHYGADVNSLTNVYYDSYKVLSGKSGAAQSGSWTPIMVYLMEYPRYFEEAKFLATQKPDLKYKDENGYNIQLLLKSLIDDRISKGESVDELRTFEKQIPFD